VAEIAGVPQGRPVDASLIAAVLAHPEGGLKGLPPQARAVAVLTQATPEHLPAGREVARRLLRSGRFERVLLTDLEDTARVGEVWRTAAAEEVEVDAMPRVHAVVLAAGRSRRMAQNKLLLPLGGKPLLAYAVDAALGAPVAAVWLVLGAEADEVRRCLEGRPVRFLLNRGWAKGQSTSLRAALAELPAWSQGALFLAGDMPFVLAEHLERMIGCLRPGVALVWSGYGERRGIPALFGRDTFAALGRLTGDRGGRMLAGLFSEEVVPAPFLPLDVDTVEEYEEACRWMERNPAGVGKPFSTLGVHGASTR
jgi:molybdenum cofactor cytidylyltransferase